MATHSSILAWKKSMDRGAWGATVHGAAKSWDTTERLTSQASVTTSGKPTDPSGLLVPELSPPHRLKASLESSIYS